MPLPKKTRSLPPSPFDDETTLGNVLMKMRALTKEQLLIAIGRKAQHDDMLLGALLRELGFVSAEQVAKALTIQASIRKGDESDASLMLMEERLDAFGAGEDRLREEIEKSKQQNRDRGEATGFWLVPKSSITGAP